MKQILKIFEKYKNLSAICDFAFHPKLQKRINLILSFQSDIKQSNENQFNYLYVFGKGMKI